MNLLGLKVLNILIQTLDILNLRLLYFYYISIIFLLLLDSLIKLPQMIPKYD